MRRIKLTIAYDGTDFHGWQVQPDLPTIQGTLEQVFTGIEGNAVHVAGSGRTDAGVHALAQVAAVSLSNPIPLYNLRKAANRLLPPSIRVLSAQEVAEKFNPRHDAVSKTYEYRVFRGEVCAPMEWRYVHHYPYPLDVERMILLAPVIEGEYDFAAYDRLDDREHESTVRTVFSSRLELVDERMIYRVTGGGFLKHMVRNIMGTLLQAGKNNLDEARLQALLVPGLTARAGPTAPAKGLFLTRVAYH